MSQSLPSLSRFELQCLRKLWAHQDASVRQVHDALDDPPSYSTVRKIFERLEAKGAVTRVRRQGAAWIYRAAVPRAAIVHGEIRRFLDQLFDGAALRSRRSGARRHCISGRRRSCLARSGGCRRSTSTGWRKHAPVKTHNVTPRYPRGANVERTVVLDGVITSDGVMDKLEVIGEADLDLESAETQAPSQAIAPQAKHETNLLERGQIGVEAADRQKGLMATEEEEDATK